MIHGSSSEEKKRPGHQGENTKMMIKKVKQKITAIYKCANIHVKSDDEPLEKTLKRLIDKINGYNE